jgi:predicted glutamine amidotransferase
MCGIVGYIGKQKAVSILIEGLKRLEYRGYDSAGVAIHEARGIAVAKKVGRVQELVKEAARHHFAGTTGISHTRWATHGGVTDANAHPHVSSDGKIALVHNGVIENFNAIKKFLTTKGYTFQSETDTEVLANLIAYHYAKEPAKLNGSGRSQPVFGERAQEPLPRRGHLRHRRHLQRLPSEMVAARKGSPLILGVGADEFILASDVSALISRTQSVVYLKDGEVVHLSSGGLQITTLDQADVSPVIDQVTWSVADSELGDFSHFMEKEIFDQPRRWRTPCAAASPRMAAPPSSVDSISPPVISAASDRFVFCGCGTAWHACLVAEHLIERFARIPVEVDYASEFRYRNVPLSPQLALLRDEPVGRNDRHARRHARGQAQGLPRARHQQCRRLHHRPRGGRRCVPARRPRNRRRLDQGLHLPAHDRRDARPAMSPACATCRFSDGVEYVNALKKRPRSRPPGPHTGRPHQGHRRAVCTRTPTCSSSDASRSSRSRSKARSSSRRSPTSTPKAIPPPR